MEESLKAFTKGVEIQDAIINIFRTYMRTFNLADVINSDRLNILIDEFNERYQSYIVKSFEDLDIQITKISEKEYILVGELMLKVAGLMASKLAAELLLLEAAGKFVKIN